MANDLLEKLTKDIEARMKELAPAYTEYVELKEILRRWSEDGVVEVNFRAIDEPEAAQEQPKPTEEDKPVRRRRPRHPRMSVQERVGSALEWLESDKSPDRFKASELAAALDMDRSAAAKLARHLADQRFIEHVDTEESFGKEVRIYAPAQVETPPTLQQ